jgi:hypothetical protein
VYVPGKTLEFERQRGGEYVLFTERNVAYGVRKHEAVSCVLAREHTVDEVTAVATFGGRIRDSAVDRCACRRLWYSRSGCARANA